MTDQILTEPAPTSGWVTEWRSTDGGKALAVDDTAQEVADRIQRLLTYPWLTSLTVRKVEAQ